VTVAVGRFFWSGQSIQKIDRFLFVLLAEMGVAESHCHGLVAKDLLKFFETPTPHYEVT